jgi:cobalamin biosynthesis protein CobD/CbiB
MDFLQNYFGEMIVGFVLAMFAWGFRSWSDTVKQVATEFRKFQIEMERRLVKLETQMHELERHLLKGHNDGDSR